MGQSATTLASIDQLQNQHANAHHHATDDTQLAWLELPHLLDHALPGLRRGEQEQAFDHEDQAQSREQVMHSGHRNGNTIPTLPSP